MTFQDLREEFPTFIYESYSYKVTNEGLSIKFCFTIEPGITFLPQLLIKTVDQDLITNKNKEVIDNLIFNLGMIEMISYWKSTCSPNVICKAGYLDEYQIKWWTSLVTKGLSEFFYTNQINYKKEKLLSITVQSNKNSSAVGSVNAGEVIVPISGGKDSLVTLNILKEKFNVGLFALNPSKATLEVMESSSINNIVEVKRTIDPFLIELNNRGFLNGHTPFSAYLAFLSVLCAYLFDYQYIAFSNENSSNEGNVMYLDDEVNHQYSKTIEFENEFIAYNQKYLTEVKYFSFLRPLFELQISKLLSTFPDELPLIKSCNKGIKDNSWCCNCPKCLSTFILLYPFIEKHVLINLFGKNMFEDGDLSKLLLSLIDSKKVKPFECVGTYDELKGALQMAINKELNTLPVLLQTAQHFLTGENFNWNESANEILKSWNDENNLPENFENLLKEKVI